MSLTLSGSTIIVDAGTTSDASELSAIAGVTTATVGSGELLRSVFDLGTLRLSIRGTLNINPFSQELMSSTTSSGSVDVANGGTLNINGSRVINGRTTYATSRWLFLSHFSNFPNSGLRVQNGGTLNWTGGEAFIPKGVDFADTAVVNLDHPIIDSYNLDNFGGVTSNEQQIRMDSRFFNCDALTLKRGFFTLLELPLSLTNYSPVQCRRSFAFSSGTPNVDLPIVGYSTQGDNTEDVSLWRGCRPVFTNAVRGTQMSVGPNGNGDSASYGFVVVRQEFNPLIIDSNKNPVQGAVVALRDYDNGQRRTFTQESYLTSSGLQVDPNQTFSYSAATNASGNLNTAINVYTGFNVVNNGGGWLLGQVNVAPAIWDYRCKSGDTTDDFDVYVASYLHNLATYPVILKGGAAVTAGTTLFSDTKITETDKAIVDAHTLINSSARFYDKAKSYLVDNYNREVAPLVDVSGSVLDLGSYNLIINNSGTAFAFDGSTFTINSNGGFTGSIITTGTVTNANNVAVSGYVHQASSKSVKINVTGLISGANVVVKDGSNNILTEGTPSGTSLTLDYTGTAFPTTATIYSGKSDYGFKANTVVITETGVSAFVGLQTDTFYQGSPPTNAPTLDFNTGTITLTGDITIQELYDVVKTACVASGVIHRTDRYPSTPNGNLWIIPWNIDGVGTLTGTGTINTEGRTEGTGAVSVSTQLIVNNLQIIDFSLYGDCVVKVVRNEDQAVIVSFNTYTDSVQFNADAWGTTSKLYEVFIRDSAGNNYPSVFQFDASSGALRPITLEALPISFNGNDVSSIISNIARNQSGPTLDLSFNELTINSSNFGDYVDFLYSTDEYADTMIANNKNPLTIVKSDQYIVDSAILTFSRNNLTTAQRTFISSYFDDGNEYGLGTFAVLDVNQKFVESYPGATGTAVLSQDTENLVLDIRTSLQFIPKIIYVDTSLATNGDGSNASPYNIIDSAITKFDEGGYTYISLKSTVAQPAVPTISMAGVKVQGVDKFSVLDFNGQRLDGATVTNLLVQGQQSALDTVGVIIEDSRIIGDFLNFKGIVKESEVVSLTNSDITIGVSGQGTLLDSSVISGGDVIIDLTNSLFFGMRGADGIIQVANMTAGIASFELNSGEVDFRPSCTGGAVRMNDTVKLKDQSVGVTFDTTGLTLSEIPKSTWEYNISAINTENQAGKELKDAQTGGGGSYDDTLLQSKVDSILADTSATIPNQISVLNNISVSDVWSAATRSLTDKLDFELSATERQAIAAAVESALLNEGDGQQLIDAIVQAIGNENITASVIADAVRDEIERSGGMLEKTNINSNLIPATI